MKKFQLLFTALQVPVDFLMVWAAFLLSYWLRVQDILPTPPVTYMMPWPEYVRLTGGIALGWVIIFAVAGLYSVRGRESFWGIFHRVFIAVSVSLALFIMVLFGAKETFFSRLIAAYAWVLGIILVMLGRGVLTLIQRLLARRDIARERIMIIGDTAVAEEIKKYYERTSVVVRLLSPTALREASSMGALIDPHLVDQVIMANELTGTNGLNLELINFCEINGIRFRYIPSLTELHSLHVISEVMRGYPILELKPTPLDGWGSIVKRAFDFVLSAVAIIILAPVMIPIAIIVRKDSPGPALFIQRRPGQFGKEFLCYKFRSMHTHLSTGEQYGGAEAEALRSELKTTSNEAGGLLFKMKKDPRVTKIGQWLRKTSLDELPQLFNILSGEMSLVGPRPPLLDEVAQYNPKHFRRLMVKPGLTGMWQVSGRSDASFDEYLKLDMYYIEHWSLWLDIQIILKTVWVVVMRKGAY
ncbi:MAG: sugar transferase [Patescibacteria group bacterium]